jgi:DHA3 family macrolide efflux protein-like MFS transporter
MNKNWKRNTVLFLTSQAVSLLGSMLVQYAITWHITLSTQSGAMMALSIICGFVPTFLISPFAGVWADRFSRKTMIIFSDSLTAAATLVLAILFMSGYDSIGLLFAALAVRSVGAGIQSPAVGAFLPQLVPGDKLLRVNGINGSMQSLIALVSPLASGALLGIASIDKIFFIDVITAAAAISILLIFLHVPPHAKALEKKKVSYFNDMREGIKYIGNHAFIRTIFIFSAIFFVLVAPLAFLTSLQVARNFGDDVWRLSVVEASFSAGMMAGGLIIASWGGFRNRMNTMVLSNLIISVCTVSLGIVPVFWIYALLMSLVGLAMPMFNTPFTVILQEKVEGDYLGRIFGVMNMISSSLMPLAMLFYGPLADVIRIEWLLITTGILMLAETCLMKANKILIDAGKRRTENIMPEKEENA